MMEQPTALRFALSVSVGWGVDPPPDDPAARRWLLTQIKRSAAREGRVVDASRVIFAMRPVDRQEESTDCEWALFAEYEG